MRPSNSRTADATAACPNASEAHWPELYGELRRIAQRILRGESSAHTLQATALVNESYFRLRGLPLEDDPRRFVGVAAHAMRQVLVDHARSSAAKKRGGTWRRQPLDTGVAESRGSDELLHLNDALDRLAALDPRLAQLVELRFFGGLSHAQAARMLGVSCVTTKRLWKLAKGWLHRELAGG